MDIGLAGKVFIVTGGTAGLGLATALELLKDGARVIVSGRSQEKFDKAVVHFGRFGDNVAFLAGDNADVSLADKLGTAALDRWGRLDGALISVGGPKPSKVLATDDDSWREVFETVFLGTVRLIRDLAPMINDGGAIAIVLAVSAKEAAPSIPLSNGFRPGLAMLVKNFADELSPRNIRVNALLPSMFATERVTQLLGSVEPPLGNASIKRIGDPGEFGRMAAVLLSPTASFVTGAAVPIDGGLLKSL